MSAGRAVYRPGPLFYAVATLDHWTTNPEHPRPARRVPRHKEITVTPPASLLPSIPRTLVPLLVGYFAALPVVRALGLTDDQMVGLVTVLVSAVYWLVVRLLEKVAPQFGWLLGYASPPVYAPPAVVATNAAKGDSGQVDVVMILVVFTFIGVLLLLFGVNFN